MIGPSVLASDKAALASQPVPILQCNNRIASAHASCSFLSTIAHHDDRSALVLDLGADYLHLDVMDGHFVPNLTFGAPIIKDLRKNVGRDVFLDVHLMVSEPEKWVNDMADAGADQFTFHIEATTSPVALIRSVKKNGMKCGVAIKPGTPASAVAPYAHDVDTVLVMTVEPGFGGQSFMTGMMPKVAELRKQFPDLDIQVDGGLSPKTIDEAARAGANMIVAGSSVYKADDPELAMALMKRSVEKHGNGRGDAELSPMPAPRWQRTAAAAAGSWARALAPLAAAAALGALAVSYFGGGSLDRK